LPRLEHFRFNNNPQLTAVPHDLRHLEKLEFLGFADMPNELVESIDPDKGGKDYWVIKHIPLVLIRQKVGPKLHDYEVGPKFHDYELRPISMSPNV
jgi:disease resistance protein RPM1